MSRPVNHPDKLSDQQRSIIRQGTLAGKDWIAVFEKVNSVKPVTQKLVKMMMEKIASELAIKSEAKKEGAQLVKEFLEKARDGAQVERMATVLEQALYRDILRRYEQAGDAIVSMTMEQLLRLEVSLRSLRATRKKNEINKNRSMEVSKLSARICVDVMDRLVQITDGKVSGQIKNARKQLIDWAVDKYGKENIKNIVNRKNEIERLSEFIARGKAAKNGGSKTGFSELAGLVD